MIQQRNTVNLLCIAGTNKLVSCSSMENDILHKSLEIHLVKSKHSLFYYMYEAKFHLQSLYSLINYIHEQYIYFICTIQVMYIYNKCIQYSMNTTQQTQKNNETREIILKLESMYQRELSEGHGINSESMKEYAMIRDEGLAGIKKMENN